MLKWLNVCANVDSIYSSMNWNTKFDCNVLTLSMSHFGEDSEFHIVFHLCVCHCLKMFGNTVIYIYIYIDPHWCQFNRLELPFWFAFHALIVLLHVVRLYIGRLATTILFVLDRTCVSVYWYVQYIVHITDWMGITDLHNTECNPHIYATLC